MLSGRNVHVVVPAFREEAHVGRVVETMPSFVDRIFVVDDGSPDRTSERARAAGAAPRVEVIRHAVRRGVGAAITTGYLAALRETTHPADALCVMAGDGQMAPEDLERVALPIVRGEADYVKGNRFGSAGVRRAMGLPRWFGGQVFSGLTALAVGQPLTDSQCGFTALAAGMAKRLDLVGLWPSFGYPNDILGQLGARRARIAEAPVQPVYGSEVSKLRLHHLPPIFFLIGRAALRRQRARFSPGTFDDRARGAAAPSPSADVPQTDDNAPAELQRPSSIAS